MNFELRKSVPPSTGYPMPALCQDCCFALFEWFARQPDARRLVRLACDAIRSRTPKETGADLSGAERKI